MNTYAVLGLSGNSVIALASALDGDSLLAVHRLARDKVGRSKQILLPAASNEHTLVAMRLDNDLLAALCSLCTATTRAELVLALLDRQLGY